jgi:very-short-patch-repair endonuclease
MSPISPTHVLLDRHQVRRIQSIPTISLLCGPVGLAIQTWHQWNRKRSVPVVILHQEAEHLLVSAWSTALSKSVDLTQAAIGWLASRVGGSVEEWNRKLKAQTVHDLEQTLRATGADVDDDPVARLSLLLLRWHVEMQTRSAPLLAARLQAAALTGDVTRESFIAALATLVGAEHAPAILIMPGEESALKDWLERCAYRLGSLAQAVPILPVAVAAPSEAVDACLEQTPNSHWQALLREGMVPIEGLLLHELNQRLKSNGLDPSHVLSALQRLVADGVSADLAEKFAEAARHVEQRDTTDQEDEARSKEERFLYERLESLAATAGLFALNQRVDFLHGHVPAEIDLLCADLKLAIEVDGSYYHLGNQDAYRRDRRKDWLLQRQGYLVLRFLADDVVLRLEEILDTILAAVELRRRPGALEGPTNS